VGEEEVSETGSSLYLQLAIQMLLLHETLSESSLESAVNIGPSVASAFSVLPGSAHLDLLYYGPPLTTDGLAVLGMSLGILWGSSLSVCSYQLIDLGQVIGFLLSLAFFPYKIEPLDEML
jgi:hypothetical protein